MRQFGLKIKRQYGPAPRRPVAAGQSDALVEFIMHVRDTVQTQGSGLLVITLPQRGAAKDLYHDRLANLPDDIPLLDLHERYSDQLATMRWIAEGHYGPDISRLIADALADRMRRLDPQRFADSPQP
jgi:hypothetical protein